MRVLLHMCCGPCATSSIEELLIEGFEVVGFYYNPNIHPVDEYEIRKKTAEKVCLEMGIDLIAGFYDRQIWFEEVRGLQNIPEGGERCKKCFDLRLSKAYKKMKELNLDMFTTTLTLSPHKDARLINQIGHQIGGNRFLPKNFKKKEGHKKSIEKSKDMGLYRQDYCGCIYSLEEVLRGGSHDEKK